MTKQEFLEKYPKPKKCPIPQEIWEDGLSYCFGYAITIDDGEVWDESKHCPCEIIKVGI